MPPIRVSPVDASRGADPATTASAQTQQAVVSREAQQRFERLMQGEPKQSIKASSDGKKQAAGTVFDETSIPAHVADHFGKMPDQTESSEGWTAQQQSSEHHQPDLADASASIGCAPTACVYEDDSASIDSVDAGVEDQSSGQQDQLQAQPLATGPLPTPLELVARAAGTPVVYSHSTASVSHSVETRLIDLARAVSDRILVSDVANVPQEVHIQVKEAILPGTEIRLSEQAGYLQVRLITDQQSSLQFLTQQQAALSAQLEQALARHVIVHVDFDSLSQFSSHHQSQSQSQSQGHSSEDNSGHELVEQSETDER